MQGRLFVITSALMVCCTIGVVGQAETVIVLPTQDATLDSAEAFFPHNGYTSTVWNAGESGRLFREVEYWDLSDYAGSTVNSASFTIEFKDFGSAETRPIMENYSIKASEVGWSESDVTWANFSFAYDPCDLLLTASVPAEAVEGDSLTIPVSAAVIQDWIDDPCTNAGWMWKLTTAYENGIERGGYEWWSSEADPCDPCHGVAAYLTIDANIPPPWVPDFEIITNRDNYLKEKKPTGQYGTSTTSGAYVNDTPKRFRGAISFDMTGFSGYTVTDDAVLRVKLPLQRGGVVGFYPILESMADWSEGKKQGAGVGGPYNDWLEGTTWANFHDKFDANSPPLFTADWSGVEEGTGHGTVTVPASVVQGWIDGMNPGLMVKMVDENPLEGYEFYTRDNRGDANDTPPTLMFDAEASPIRVELNPDRSTYLSEAEPNVVQWPAGTSYVQIDPNIGGEYRYRSMLSFDVSASAGAHVVGDGTMRLSLMSQLGQNDPIEVYSVDPAIAGWDPNEVKWEDNANSYVGPVLASADLSWVTRRRTGAIKIPASVIQGWIDGVNPGLFLKLQNEIADPAVDGNPIGYGYTNVDITDWVDEWEVVALIPQVSLSFLAAPPGDANLNGKVDKYDLHIVSANWLESAKAWTDGDFTGDGIVNLEDVAVMTGNWLYGVL